MVAHSYNPSAAGDRQNPGAHWLVNLVNSGGSRPLEDSVTKTPETDVTWTAAPEIVLYIHTSCTMMQAHLHMCEVTHTHTHKSHIHTQQQGWVFVVVSLFLLFLFIL